MTNNSARMQSRKNEWNFRFAARETALWWAFWVLLLFSLWLIVADIANFHFLWKWDGYAQQGGVIAASSIAALSVLSGVKSWADEIRVKRDDAEQAAYARLVKYLMNQFVVGDANETLAAMRADVVLCASQLVVEKLAQYNTVVNKVKNEGSPVPGSPAGSTYTLTPEGSSLIRQVTAEIVAAIRSESGLEDTDLNAIECALFDDVPDRKTPENTKKSLN